MSRYFIYQKMWEAVSDYFSEGRNPHMLDAWRRGEAEEVMESTMARFNLIHNFIVSNGPETQLGAKIGWMCIRPPNGTPFSDLQHKVEKFCKKSYLVRWMYCYEQSVEAIQQERGEWTLTTPDGFHVHMLFEFSNTFDSVLRALKQLFKGWNLFLKPCPERYVPSKINYMMGNKDAEKAAKIKGDEIWRINEGLAAFVMHGSWDMAAEADVLSNNPRGQDHAIMDRLEP